MAFVRDGNIYIVNKDGTDVIQLTSGRTSGHPAWSPDGQRIAFVREVSSTSEIYVINADGSGLQPFARGRSPAWAPDGRRIAFAALAGGENRIFVKSVENDGTPAITIGFDVGYQDWPAWSPDGSKIAFVSDEQAFDFAFEIYVANADGSNVVQVTNGFFGSRATWPTYTIYAQPAWSPDGRKLAIVACLEWQYTDCETSSVGVVDVDGSNFRLLATTTGFAKPTWASDGSAVAFSRTCWDHRCASNVFQVAAGGGDERLLIANGHSAAWRP
jgi:Tol biopolymer transport system component